MLSFYVNPLLLVVVVLLLFLNDTCVYAFAECREARDVVSQEVCSHARAGVLAKQCVCVFLELPVSDVCPPF